MDNLLLYINMNNLSDTYFFAVSNQSSTFLRPRFIQIVVLEFTHFELVYILVLFFLHFARRRNEVVRKLGQAGCSYS